MCSFTRPSALEPESLLQKHYRVSIWKTGRYEVKEPKDRAFCSAAGTGDKEQEMVGFISDFVFYLNLGLNNLLGFTINEKVIGGCTPLMQNEPPYAQGGSLVSQLGSFATHSHVQWEISETRARVSFTALVRVRLLLSAAWNPFYPVKPILIFRDNRGSGITSTM